MLGLNQNASSNFIPKFDLNFKENLVPPQLPIPSKQNKNFKNKFYHSSAIGMSAL